MQYKEKKQLFGTLIYVRIHLSAIFMFNSQGYHWISHICLDFQNSLDQALLLKVHFISLILNTYSDQYYLPVKKVLALLKLQKWELLFWNSTTVSTFKWSVYFDDRYVKSSQNIVKTSELVRFKINKTKVVKKQKFFIFEW